MFSRRVHAAFVVSAFYTILPAWTRGLNGIATLANSFAPPPAGMLRNMRGT